MKIGKIQKKPKLPNRIRASYSVGSAEDTTRKIILSSLEALRDPRILTMVRVIVKDIGGVNRHPIAARVSEIAVVDQFVRENIRYTRDPIGVELVHTPTAILDRIESYQRWSEDCESIAGLVLSLLMALGQQCRLTIVGYGIPNRFSHIFVESFIPKIGWLVIDPTTGSRELARIMCKRITTFRSFYPEQFGREFDARSNRMP